MEWGDRVLLMIAGMILAFLLVFFLGDTGLIILAALAFGMLFSTYGKVRILLEDMETIKKKWGIEAQSEREKELNTSDEETEKALEELSETK
jgi:hypothetical protein